MPFLIHFVAVAVAVFEEQFAFAPIAAHTFHAVILATVHQPFGEETAEVADAAHDGAAEEVLVVAHLQHPEHSAFIFVLLNRVDVHREARRADLDDPTVAFLGTKIIEHGKLLQILVPPIHLIVSQPFFIDVFPCHFRVFALVVQSVGADDDGHVLVVDGGVGGIFQMLEGDAAVLVLDFVVPFGLAFADVQILEISLYRHIEIGHHKLVVSHGNPEGFVVSLIDHHPVKHIIRLNLNGIGDFLAHHRRIDRKRDLSSVFISYNIDIVLVAVFLDKIDIFIKTLIGFSRTTRHNQTNRIIAIPE